MLEELRRYNNVGDAAGIAYFAKQVFSSSRVQTSSVQKLCGLQNSIRLNFKAAVAFFTYLQLVREDAGFLHPTERALELRESSDFDKKLCTICLAQISNDGFLDTDAIHYSKERNAYIVEKYGFSVSAALFRNVLIQYKALKENLGDLVLNPEYEDVFARCKRRQRTKKSLEQLKKQLELQEIQGERAELFVMDYEKKRLSAFEKQKGIKRISEIDVSAGYDILSYENECSLVYDRFVEVKSYSGNPHFYWSKNEIETAELYEDKYYIYLVDILKINSPDYNPMIIRNPAKNIWKNDSWIMDPTSYLVIPTE